MILTDGTSMSMDSKHGSRSWPGCGQRPLLMDQIGSLPPGSSIVSLLPEGHPQMLELLLNGLEGR